MFQKIIKEICSFDTVIIHRHKNPDGDALGAQIGLKYLIKDNFPEKTVYVVGDSSRRYGFMEDTGMDTIDDSVYQNALAVVLDTAASSLICDDRYKIAARSVRLDHHIFCEKITDVEVINTSYESCCGLVTELALAAGWKLSEKSAKALYTGMVTDSGRFRYDSTTANTHRLASALMEQKFDTTDIYANLYADEYSFIRLRAQFVLKIQFTPHRVAFIYTDLEEAKSYEADTFTISRGMVNTMGDIRGVDIWVNFTETEDGVLAELRSSKYNVNAVATKYGGGGHVKASGATLKSREEAMAMLEDLNNICKGEAV